MVERFSYRSENQPYSPRMDIPPHLKDVVTEIANRHWRDPVTSLESLILIIIDTIETYTRQKETTDEVL